MFGEIAKLFDRNFAVAFFLPAILFLLASGWILNMLGLWPDIFSQLTAGSLLLDTTVAAVVAWIIGILLWILNLELYRFLEGYGTYNPLRLFENRSKATFLRKRARLDELYAQSGKKAFPPEFQQEWIALSREMAQNYPDEKDWVLPTPFGNAIRAFEVYTRVMYGLDSIDGWPRIFTLLPKDGREPIDEAKALVDWWLNLGVLSFFLLIEFWLVVFFKWRFGLPWYLTLLNILIPLLLFALLNWNFMRRATTAVIGWGDTIKSAFDVYRLPILTALGVDPPKSRKAERELWTRLSRAMIYRDPESLPRLSKNLGSAKK